MNLWGHFSTSRNKPVSDPFADIFCVKGNKSATRRKEGRKHAVTSLNSNLLRRRVLSEVDSFFWHFLCRIWHFLLLSSCFLTFLISRFSLTLGGSSLFTFDLIKIQVQKDRKTQKEPKTNLYNQNMQKQRQIYIVFISLTQTWCFIYWRWSQKKKSLTFLTSRWTFAWIM